MLPSEMLQKFDLKKFAESIEQAYTSIAEVTESLDKEKARADKAETRAIKAEGVNVELLAGLSKVLCDVTALVTKHTVSITDVAAVVSQKTESNVVALKAPTHAKVSSTGSVKFTIDEANAYMRLPYRKIESLIYKTDSNPMPYFENITPNTARMVGFYQQRKVGDAVLMPNVTLKDVPAIIFECHVAQALGISKEEVRTLVKQKKLYHYPINANCYVFDMSDIRAYAKSKEITLVTTIVKHLVYFNLRDRYLAENDGIFSAINHSAFNPPSDQTLNDLMVVSFPEFSEAIKANEDNIWKLGTKYILDTYLPNVASDIKHLKLKQYLHKYCTSDADGNLLKFEASGKGMKLIS